MYLIESNAFEYTTEKKINGYLLIFLFDIDNIYNLQVYYNVIYSCT